MKWRWLGLLCLMLAGCGYHLAGNGGQGVLHAGERVALVSEGLAPRYVAMLRARLARDGIEVLDARRADADAVLLVRQQPARYVPSAYDRTGVATQYRMTLSGSVRIERAQRTVWDSGAVQATGDVYVAGGPASVEASRAQLEESLQRQWLRAVYARMKSGF
ncbi:MAG: adenosylmethionine-8-amino-7-oxononanoate aminotransferase [Zetaproteobacteria bacterium]|nr:MAG: adenosylmethionine-8-amino-7-oxononanoate aminotransferase [Zetaproteobacteria bacterium]